MRAATLVRLARRREQPLGATITRLEVPAFGHKKEFQGVEQGEISFIIHL